MKGNKAHSSINWWACFVVFLYDGVHVLRVAYGCPKSIGDKVLRITHSQDVIIGFVIAVN